ncbi:MAG: hypothetical protein HZB41_02200 [Ignavibacteriae bacterium]|nr:hypothetical protein [Ignavibacteriota bacterium]
MIKKTIPKIIVPKPPNFSLKNEYTIPAKENSKITNNTISFVSTGPCPNPSPTTRFNHITLFILINVFNLTI